MSTGVIGIMEDEIASLRAERDALKACQKRELDGWAEARALEAERDAALAQVKELREAGLALMPYLPTMRDPVAMKAAHVRATAAFETALANTKEREP